MFLIVGYAKLLIKFLYWGFAYISFSIDNIAEPIDLTYDVLNFIYLKKKSFYKNNYKKYYQ